MKDLIFETYKKLEIKVSRISGRGLFSKEKIFKGELVLRFGGYLDTKEYRYSGSLLRSTCIGLSDSVIIGEKSFGTKDLSDYINHSCNPNIGLYDALTLVAICDIEKGSELLCDYSFWENNEDWVMKDICNCGYEKCRREINGKYWKQISVGDKNFKYYSPYLKRRIING